MRQHQNQARDRPGPSLPKALLNGGSSSRKRQPPSRKERRKAERQQKKTPLPQRKPRVLQSRKLLTRPADDDFSSDDEEGAPLPASINHSSTAPAANSNTTQLRSILKKTKKQEPKTSETRSPSPPRHISRGVRDKLAQDDAEIAALEKKLGLKGKKKSSAGEDGLDDLLDGLDDGLFGGEKPSKRKRSEDAEWLEQKRRRVASQAEVDDGDDDEDSAEDEDSLDGLDDDDSDDAAEQEGSDSYEDSVLGDESKGADEGQSGDSADDFEEFGSDGDSEAEAARPRVRENPYVAPTVAGSSAPHVVPAGKYIPPSLRTASSSDAESMQRLRRQCQGLLNRLSEANLVSILQSIEQLYQSNPRQYVTTTLIDLLLGLICDKASLMDTFLILHAGLIAAIYKVIGTDFGAQVVERIVGDFDKYLAADQASSKETSNLMSLLAELYNFQVVGANIVFDYIRSFLEELSEQHTELLLRVIRSSGSQLRHDDPSALKDIVVLMQKAATKMGEQNLSVRTKFMIETINSLKNNRMKTGIAASAVVSEHTTRMKKTLGSLNTRSVKASEPLRVSLADIRDTEKKGKWWLVGASYHDPAKLANGNDSAQTSQLTPAQKRSAASADDATADLLELAREQRMNTDVRRAIFITIMSASDYKDAHLRLMKLNLKKTQELEIPRVLIHCTGAEERYNPYYTLIARKLCGERKLRMAFQFGLWDLFKRMGERDDEAESDDEADESGDMGTRKIVNLVNMFASLIKDGGLSITVLKNLNFAYLQSKTAMFLEILLTAVVQSGTSKDPDQQRNAGLSVQEIMAKAHEVPEMISGLRYFVETVVAKAGLVNGKHEQKAVRKGCKSAVEALAADATKAAVLETD